jgi:phosphoenolpyruvate carboxylase
MKRKCAYTGKESLCTDKVIPRELSDEEIHNWTNSLPCSIEYKESKGADFPNDLEAEIHETFYLLEIYRWKVKYLEKKLEILQQQNNTRRPIKKTGAAQKKKEKAKEKQIEAAIKEKQIVEDNSLKIEEFLNTKKKTLF